MQELRPHELRREKRPICCDIDDGCGAKLHCGDCDDQKDEVCYKGRLLRAHHLRSPGQELR